MMPAIHHRRAVAARQARSSAGFTLLEIMVALAVGGVALSSIYAVGAASTRHFREQGRISGAQTSLRSAMDQLKRDFQRAGFLATPNVRAPNEACGLPGAPLDDTTGGANTGRLAAISSFTNNIARPTALDPDNYNTWATVDEVTLMGNYATSGEYMGITVSADGLTVQIPTQWQSFQRDFTEWSGASAGQCNTTAFTAAFAVGRLVRIHTLTERNFFSTVASAQCPNAGPAIVVLTTAIPAQCNANLGWIAPVNTIGYRVVNAADTEVSRSTVNRVALLRRTELLPTNKAQPLTLPGNGPRVDDRAILDYVVSFDVQFLLRGGAPSSVNFLPTTEANVDAFPERLRGVIIDLASRTTEQELEFDSQSLPPGLAFRVLNTRGGARVRRLHAELLLPNVAYRNY
jgi:prepilin-type N-terminal cleavage/methylation domain-containing protein